MKLNIKNRDLVIPGEFLAEGECLLGEGTFRKGDKVYSSLLGLVDAKENFVKIIPFNGTYVPSPRDLVIGVITDISFSNWSVDLNSPYSGLINLANATDRYIENGEDLSKIYNVGDVVVAKIIDVAKSMNAGLTMKDRGLFKLNEGRLININPTKVPRVIGKQGTMVQMLKTATNCKIIVGQNGRIWISGENTDKAVEVIRLIEREAHTSGLTEKVQNLLGLSETASVATGAELKPKPVQTEAPKPVVEEAKPAPVEAPKPVSAEATSNPVESKIQESG